MKITLDIGKLLEDGKITQDEFDKLYALSSRSTGSLAFNILIGFGVIAVSGGALALFQDALASLILGVLLSLFGIFIARSYQQEWGVLAAIALLCGALMLGGGVLILMELSQLSFILISGIFILSGIYAQSGLLISLAVLSISSALGSGTAYEHATYFVWVKKPLATIVIFALAAVFLYIFSKSLKADYSRLAIIAARTCVLMVNLGFWIGSLWGDAQIDSSLIISRDTFIITWALALLLTGIWAAKMNLRWTVNVVAVFAAIHLYTQWFERIGPSAISFLMAGTSAIILAVAIWKYNQKMVAS